MQYEFTEKTLNPQPVLTIKASTTPAEVSSTLAEILPKVWGYLEKSELEMVGPPFTRYHHIGEDRIELEGGIPVNRSLHNGEALNTEMLPAGDAVTTIHWGDYAGLGEAHAAIAKYLAENGKTVAGAPWEIYWTDPGQVPDPKEWKTEIVYPVK